MLEEYQIIHIPERMCYYKQWY